MNCWFGLEKSILKKKSNEIHLTQFQLLQNIYFISYLKYSYFEATQLVIQTYAKVHHFSVRRNRG